MKTVTTFNKESVYSDIEPNCKDATFLKYLGADADGVWFRFIGGDKSYITFNHPEFGISNGFPIGEEMYELSEQEVQELISE